MEKKWLLYAANSVFPVKLAIKCKPQQNGRHERMHLTLKKEAYNEGNGNAGQCLIQNRYN
jgi:hypothetical protein